MMGYPILVRERAREALEALRQGKGVPEGAIREDATVQSSPGDLARLVAELKALLPGRPIPERGREGFDFDVQAAVLIHRLLDRHHPALVDRDFWRYLAVVELHEVIDWRHGGPEGRAKNLENFGIGGSLVECYPYRCWLQADIAYEERLPDPYAWARLGDPDTWRSHLFRQNWARDRRVAKAFLKTVFGAPGAGSTVRGPDPRKLAKELRRVAATLTLAALDEESLDDLMEELAARCS